MKPRNDLTFEEVSKRYRYNPDTGTIFSIKARRNVGTIGGGGYIILIINQRQYKAHRIAWLLHYGEWPQDEIDHIDGNVGNNTLSNLRAVNRAKNAINRKLNKNNTSGYRGVSWYKKHQKWRALIAIDGKWVNLGYYKNLDEAIAVRKAKEQEIFGEFSRTA